jgi:hypothetical protein
MASAKDLLVVPVRSSRSGTLAVRTARLAGEGRVGIAFTSVTRLREVLGSDQAWVRLHESALRPLLRPLGVTRIQVDPDVMVPRIPVDAAGVAPVPEARTEPRSAVAETRMEPRSPVGVAVGSSVARDG